MHRPPRQHERGLGEGEHVPTVCAPPSSPRSGHSPVAVLPWQGCWDVLSSTCSAFLLRSQWGLKRHQQPQPTSVSEGSRERRTEAARGQCRGAAGEGLRQGVVASSRPLLRGGKNSSWEPSGDVDGTSWGAAHGSARGAQEPRRGLRGAPGRAGGGAAWAEPAGPLRPFEFGVQRLRAVPGAVLSRWWKL